MFSKLVTQQYLRIDGECFFNNVEKVIGTHFNDKFTLTGGTIHLDGGPGNDTLIGAGFDDSLYGGDGNDTINGGAGKDSIFGGDGNDNLSGGAGNDTIYGGAGDDTITTTSGEDWVYGGLGNDRLTGGKYDEHLEGGSGNDVIIGAGGNDALWGSEGNDSINGGAGADTISGGAGNDTITLTKDSAAVDSVILDWSENGANIDIIDGFTTTSTGDEIQLDLSALESAIAAGGIAATTDFAVLESGASLTAAASVVQLLTATAAVAEGANVFVLQGATFGSKADVEDALETGGSMALTGLHADVAANDAFIAVWTDGTNAYVTAVHMTTETAADGDFEAGDLTTDNLAIFSGVTSISSSTFALANFEWVV